jgi:hypothetical protein
MDWNEAVQWGKYMFGWLANKEDTFQMSQFIGSCKEVVS